MSESDQALKEKPFRNMVFTTTGLNQRKEINENQYVQHIKDLGGIYSEKFTSETKYLVVFSNLRSAKYEHVVKNCSYTVLLDYPFVYNIYNKWKNAENIDMEYELRNGMPKPFMKCRVYVEPSDNSQYLVDEIQKNGGTVCENIDDRINIYVWTGDFDEGVQRLEEINNKYRKDRLKYRFCFVHKNWVLDSLKAQAYLNPKNYILSVYDPSKIKVRKFNINSSLLPKNYNEYSVSTLQKPVPLLKRKLINDQWNELSSTKKRATLSKASTLETTYNGSSKINSTTGNAINKLIFDDCVFFLFGYDKKKNAILKTVAESNGGRIVSDENDSKLTHIIINSTLHVKNIPDYSLWKSRRNIIVGTEWLIERSIDKKRVVNDVWGSFIEARDLPDFQDLNISISGFKGTELLHIERLISVLGGNYCPLFNSEKDLLVAVPGSTKEPYAKKWNIPVVGPEWLWKSALLGKQFQPVDSLKSQ